MTDVQTIVEQQIIDILMTNYGERVMAPRYGANLRGFLFSPARDDVLQLKAGEAKALLVANISLATIHDVTMRPVVGAGNESTVRLSVSYAIKPGNSILVLNHLVSGLITEETSF